MGCVVALGDPVTAAVVVVAVIGVAVLPWRERQLVEVARAAAELRRWAREVWRG